MKILTHWLRYYLPVLDVDDCPLGLIHFKAINLLFDTVKRRVELLVIRGTCKAAEPVLLAAVVQLETVLQFSRCDVDDLETAQFTQ